MSLLPVVEGEIVGFRRWLLEGHRPRSIIMPYVWVPGTNTAKCSPVATRRPCFPCPGDSCHCGFNAFYDLGSLNEQDPLLGIVVGWGDVYTHSNAWRAEFARVVAVIDTDWSRKYGPYGRLYVRAASYLGVPTIRLEDAEAFAGEYGTRVPAELVPGEVRNVSEERG